jgi:multidrug resistance efflux pump
MKRILRSLLLLILIGGAGAYYYLRAQPAVLVLTGLVTTQDVIVSAQIPGQIIRLAVKEGDRVEAGQVIAEISPDELRADTAYFAQAAQSATSQVTQSEAALRWEEQQAGNSVRQAEASQAAAEASQKSAEADLENAKLTYDRSARLVKEGVVSAEQFDQSRTTYDALKARVASLSKQVEQARVAVSIARSNAEQVAMRRGQLQASRHGSAAAAAQQTKAEVRLKYTEVRAPLGGQIDVRAARQGEVVAAGQAIVTIVNPDDLWVRVDVEESYIEHVKLGDTLTVRLPSGVEAPGTVIFRGVDAGYATQRDVSRTKRDIKTFEVRLRVDNAERRLAVGMTAYVLFPTGR